MFGCFYNFIIGLYSPYHFSEYLIFLVLIDTLLLLKSTLLDLLDCSHLVSASIYGFCHLTEAPFAYDFNWLVILHQIKFSFQCPQRRFLLFRQRTWFLLLFPWLGRVLMNVRVLRLNHHSTIRRDLDILGWFTLRNDWKLDSS
jgi:hypothetical protein